MNKIVYNFVSVTKEGDEYKYETLRDNLVIERDFVLSRGYTFEGVLYNYLGTRFNFDTNVCDILVTPVNIIENE